MKCIRYLQTLTLLLSSLVAISENLVTKEQPMTQKDIHPSKLERAEFVCLDNGFHVWTKRIDNGPIKILTLHGGPGCTHKHLECFEDFFPKDQFQVIFYDQLGAYHSDQPEDTSLWTVERFRDEVQRVLQALGLENFYLYDQS